MAYDASWSPLVGSEVRRLAGTLGKRVSDEQIAGWLRVLEGTPVRAVTDAINDHLANSEAATMPSPGHIRKLARMRMPNRAGIEAAPAVWKTWTQGDYRAVMQALMVALGTADTAVGQRYVVGLEDIDPVLAVEALQAHKATTLPFGELRLAVKSYCARRRKVDDNVRWGRPATAEEANEWHGLVKEHLAGLRATEPESPETAQTAVADDDDLAEFCGSEKPDYAQEWTP
jgi:hypothetical protein